MDTERVADRCAVRATAAERIVPSIGEDRGHPIDESLQFGQTRPGPAGCCAATCAGTPYRSEPTGSWLGWPGTSVTNGRSVAYIASVDANDTWSTITASGSSSSHSQATSLATRSGSYSRSLFSIERLTPDRGDRTLRRGGDEPLDRRDRARDAAVRARAEAQQAPLEAVGLDTSRRFGPGGDHDPMTGVGRRRCEHRERPVVRREVGTDDEQAHCVTIGGR